MHSSRCFSALAVLALCASVALPAQAVASGFGEVVSVGPQASKAPYTLTRTFTSVQTLADGTTITQTRTEKMARDSQGRSYNETRQTQPFGPDGQPFEWIHGFVFDPVARTNINWDNHTKTASVMHMPDPETIQHRPESVQLPRAALQPQTVRPRPQTTREDLGFKTIAGVEAKGTRFTNVIPTGEQGNDRPLTIVTERWVSEEYGVELSSIRDDPRTGKQTTEVTDFQPGEPDPALFQVPQGYTIREHAASAIE
jgi:hypothetical protein